MAKGGPEVVFVNDRPIRVRLRDEPLPPYGIGSGIMGLR